MFKPSTKTFKSTEAPMLTEHLAILFHQRCRKTWWNTKMLAILLGCSEVEQESACNCALDGLVVGILRCKRLPRPLRSRCIQASINRALDLHFKQFPPPGTHRAWIVPKPEPICDRFAFILKALNDDKVHPPGEQSGRYLRTPGMDNHDD